MEKPSGYYSITAVTAWDGTLTVTGGTFTKNSGIAVGNSGGTVTISGGEIYDNTGSGAGNRYGTIWIAVGTKDNIVTKMIEEDNGRDKNLASATSGRSWNSDTDIVEMWSLASRELFSSSKMAR